MSLLKLYIIEDFFVPSVCDKKTLFVRVVAHIRERLNWSEYRIQFLMTNDIKKH